MRRMYDAATAPSSPPRWDVVGGYIGGDDYHTWTDAEWESQPARYRLPIFVRSNPGSHNPHTDATAALRWLQGHRVPRGCAVVLDLETAVDGPYVRAFDTDITAAGYVVVAYGSLSTIFKNPRTSGGYWVAHYTGKEHTVPGSVATQWANDELLGKPWDASLIDDSVPLWATQHQEDDMPDVVSLGVDGKQTIAGGSDASIKFSKEYSDRQKHHGDGGYSVIVDSERWAICDAIVDLTGLEPGGKADVAWSRMVAPAKDSDPWQVKDDAWRTTFRADESGHARCQLGGQLGIDKDTRLRLRVYNTGTTTVTVASVLAKVALLRYSA